MIKKMRLITFGDNCSAPPESNFKNYMRSGKIF